MELKVVYRILPKISDWSVSGFYSEAHIEGQENVLRDGPLIIASTHHNEIIDIATLAATIPHGRHVSFWAKSSMFSNPLARAILLSSGAIPVKRYPNNKGFTQSITPLKLPDFPRPLGDQIRSARPVTVPSMRQGYIADLSSL